MRCTIVRNMACVNNFLKKREIQIKVLLFELPFLGGSAVYTAVLNAWVMKAALLCISYKALSYREVGTYRCISFS